MALIVVTNATFRDPEEGAQAALERLATAAAHYEVASTGAVHALIDLSLMACGSDRAVSMSVPSRTLDVLGKAGVITWSTAGKVVLV
jgi:hypothetical protein